MIFLTSGLEAEPGPGRALGVAGRPAGFAGRAKPAPGPNLVTLITCECNHLG